MTLTQLRYLAALADHGHFGRAAEACGVSQPTLSTQLKKLEAYLDAPLIVRGCGAASLTPLGERVCARARQMLALEEEVKGVARRAGEPLVGPFRIGAIPTFCPYFLPWALPALRARFPRLELVTQELRTEDALRALRRRALDAALVAEPIADPAVEILTLFDEPFLAALPPDHPLAKQSSVSAAALAREKLLVLDEGHCLRDQTLQLCGAETPDAAGARATSLETLFGLVSVGEGVTLAPALAVEGRSRPAIRPLAAPLSRRMALAHARGAPRRGEIRLMAEALRAAAPPPLTAIENGYA